MALALVLALSFHQFKSGNSFRNGWKDSLPAEGSKNVNYGSLKKTADTGMWASHRGEAGTRHWKEQRELEHRAQGAAQRLRTKARRGWTRDTGQLLQRKAKGCREVRGQGEGLALPPGCSTTFRSRGVRDTNQRLNQINKSLFPWRAYGLSQDAAVVTNAGQQRSSASCAFPAGQTLWLLLKGPHLP